MTSSAPRQLAFDIPFRPALGLEDFLVSQSNAAAVALVDRWPDWPAGAAVISGPPGSGKSHLANVWRAKSAARLAHAAEISSALVPEYSAGGALVIEDADKGQIDERALFHILNLVREHRTSVLVTSTLRPGEISLSLPDFASRLRALPVAEIAPPDDALLGAVLVKQFADRQLLVDPAVVSYCLLRMERSLEAARRLTGEIDNLALAMQRAVTRAVAAKALDNLGWTGKSVPHR